VGFHVCAPAGEGCSVIAKYKKDPKTRKIAEYMEPFFSGRTVESIVVKTGAPRKGYSTGNQHHGHKTLCAALNPAKAEQRRRLISAMRKGTVLELYAGKGYLTRGVYVGKAKRVILVDKDKKALSQADRRLKGKVRREIYAGDNRTWIREKMVDVDLSDLVAVDFDAFGSPMDTMREFFNNYKVRRPLYLSLTDGSAYWYALHKDSDGPKAARKRYHSRISRKDMGTLRGQIKMINHFMKEEGKKHRFKVEPISIAKGQSKTVYVGYLLKPA
jgi:tRNA G26 N,N-dimethylase Trm1